MAVEALRNMTPRELRRAENSFSRRYVDDWNKWLRTPREERPQLFGQILRKWQAARPHKMRRLQVEAKHKRPFLDDLLKSAAEPLRVLGRLTVLRIAHRTREQDKALTKLWKNFSLLSIAGVASCVGISKAVLLLTDGKIGPALDSRVRHALGVRPPTTAREWLTILEDVAKDIAAFEASHGPLMNAVPSRFAHLAYGRLYDMALGPRGPARKRQPAARRCRGS